MNSETSLASESLVFLLFVVSGFLCGIIYDTSEIIKSKHKKDKRPTGMYDISSGVLLSLFLVFCFIKINDLSLEISSFIGIITGCTLYFTTLSDTFYPILKFFCNFFEKIFKILLYPAKLSCIICKRCFLCAKNTFVKNTRSARSSLERFIIRIKKT